MKPWFYHAPARGFGGVMMASNLRRWRSGWSPATRQALNLFLGCAALFVAYCALGKLNQAFIFPPRNAIFWLPSGLALAWILRTPRSHWPAYLLAIFGADVWIGSWHGFPLSIIVAWALVSGLLPLLGAWLLRPPSGHPFVFSHAEDIIRLVLLAAGVGAFPCALIAAAANVTWLEAGSYWTKVATWWTSDALGVILLTPFFLVWTEPASPRFGRAVEALALLALLTTVGWWVFSSTQPREFDAALPFLLLPLIAWPALRLGARGATAATVILDLMATWHTVHERGPFAMLSMTVGTRILNLQLYISFLNLFVLILAVVVVKERQARAAAQQAEQRARFLAAASESLSASLDYAESLSALPRLCVQSLADWCVLDVVEDNKLRRQGSAHRDPSKLRLLGELAERYSLNNHSPQPAAQVLRTGEPLLLPRTTDDVIRNYSADDENVRLIRELGTHTVMAVPLALRGKMIAVLTLASANPGLPYSSTDIVFVSELGRRAAIAIDNARLYRDAQDANRLRDVFVSLASHELRTPLLPLRLRLQIILRKCARATSALDPAWLVRELTAAEHQTRRLGQLVDQLIDASSLSSDQPLELHRKRVDLCTVVEGVLESMREQIDASGCQLVRKLQGPALGEWDQRRLEQTVFQLVHNALKFGQRRPVEVSVVPGATSVRLVVRDHGLGMSESEVADIFDRFSRGVSDRHYGGLGIGLHLVKHHVEAHGGKLSVESQPDAGSTFTLELPAAVRQYTPPASTPHTGEHVEVEHLPQ
ncbi:MASE1 domain-containing protein [Cystobacter fuscus]|uniref:sensor histidine kinase n=1 Tax=Cystobacter fuscus TaxID=43 RepID=UPI002B29BC5A|nr:GAF domain-containing protein [Cystobacter fuscus]